MHGELVLSVSTLLGFLLTLARISGVFVFVPMPGVNTATAPARVIFSVGLALALFAEWPHVAAQPSLALFAFWMALEAALGAGIGLAVAFITESFLVGGQMLGLQAGYSFASTVDPTTQADSAVLVVFAQIVAGLLFFTTGMHREVLRVFARSLETYPPGSFLLPRAASEHVLRIGASMFATGLRLALPLIAVMAMIDISLALLGRVNAQLQLVHLAFPVKMMVGLVLLAWIATLFPAVFRAEADGAFAAARGLIAR